MISHCTTRDEERVIEQVAFYDQSIGTDALLSQNSPLTGAQQGALVWRRDDEVGVRFMG